MTPNPARKSKLNRVESPQQAMARAQMALSSLNPNSAVAQELWTAFRGLAYQIEALTDGMSMALEAETIAQAHRAMAEQEIVAVRKDALAKGKQYVTMLMSRELELDPAIIDVIMQWMDGTAPADVSPFFINQLRESIRELRDVIEAERGQEGFDSEDL